MGKIQAALCGTVLALAVGGGCHPSIRYDASKFDPQCPAWQALPYRDVKIVRAVAESNGMEAYYEYYMCLEMLSSRGANLERMQYFLAHVDEFIRIVPDKLRNPRHWKELYAISDILMVIHVRKVYNVGADEDLMKIWSESIRERGKYHSGFNDSLYLDVVESPY